MTNKAIFKIHDKRIFLWFLLSVFGYAVLIKTWKCVFKDGLILKNWILEVGFFTDEKLWPVKENMIRVLIGGLGAAKFRFGPQKNDWVIQAIYVNWL